MYRTSPFWRGQSIHDIAFSVNENGPIRFHKWRKSVNGTMSPLK